MAQSRPISLKSAVSYRTHSPLTKKAQSLLLLLLFLLGNIGTEPHALAQDPWIVPPALRPGDKIALVAPCGPADRSPIVEYAKQLEAAGFVVQVSDDIDRKLGYLAGSDQQRVDELNQAIRDPSVRAIMPVRGGFGITRILDQIDYASLRNDPKIITGYSDLTGLHLAVAKRARLITFHSPVPVSSLWKESAPEHRYANQFFRRTIFASEYRDGERGYTVPYPPTQTPETLVPGQAVGRIMGGNLSLIAATMGTPFEIEGNGTILFLEDVNEAPYRIDRMLSTLRLSGLFERVKGVVLGNFSPKPDEQEDTDRVLKEYFGRLSVPVLWRFPIGHVPTNATIPHGAMVEIDADSKTLRVIENPVIVR
jgi:muramoyltetrapeptide carboxypeptidase